MSRIGPEFFWTPLWKRGVWGDFMENRFIQKIPLSPPLPKGEDTRNDSRQVPLERLFLRGQAGMTDGLAYIKTVGQFSCSFVLMNWHEGLGRFRTWND